MFCCLCRMCELICYIYQYIPLPHIVPNVSFFPWLNNTSLYIYLYCDVFIFNILYITYALMCILNMVYICMCIFVCIYTRTYIYMDTTFFYLSIHPRLFGLIPCLGCCDCSNRLCCLVSGLGVEPSLWVTPQNLEPVLWLYIWCFSHLFAPSGVSLYT